MKGVLKMEHESHQLTGAKKLLSKMSRASARNAQVAGIAAFCVIIGGYVVISSFASNHTLMAAGYPETPPAQICGNAGILGGGPATAPGGAVTVPAGDNSSVNFGLPNTTYWFAPGTHTLGASQFGQIIPGNGSTYVGAPGAILDGQRLNKYAFTQQATNVTIRYLTIQNFGPVNSNNNEGVVNHDSGDGWTIEYNTIQNNAGAALMMGNDNAYRYNCIKDNGQYAINAYRCRNYTDYPNQCGGSIQNAVVEHNEIAGNNQDDWESQIEGCGCTGGIKFWDVENAQVTNNYVHGNLSVGIWLDNNNRGFLIEGNYIEGNYSQALFLEAGYDAKISKNYIKDNAWGEGRSFVNNSFPIGAIYISENGSDPAFDPVYYPLSIDNNFFDNNWGGVVLWENADRYCSSPAHTHGDYCTLYFGDGYDPEPCNETNIASQPDIYKCRWSTQNVLVENNDFVIDKDYIGEGCADNYWCGVSGIFSNYGTYPSWSPFQAFTIADRIIFDQNNVFRNNSYEGDWVFRVRDQGSDNIGWNTWTSAPYSQDVGSTYSGLSTEDPGGGSGGGGGGSDPPGTIGGTKTFETGTENMSAWYNSTVALSTSVSHGGTNSLAITATGGNWGIEESWPGNIGVTGGEEYEISAWVRADSTARAITMSAKWFDSSNATVGTAATANATDNNSGWTEITTTVTAPADAVRVQFIFTAGAGSAGEIHYLDDVSVVSTAPDPDPDPPAGKLGDLNDDNNVNIFDLSILLANWNKALADRTNAKVDLNDDGSVNIFDLSILLNRWGT